VKNVHYCERCDKTFGNPPLLLYHFKRKHKNEIPPQFKGRKLFHCEICAEFFYREKSLATHIESKHGSEEVKKRFQFECPECQKIITSKRRLKEHVQNMHGERKFICPNCSKGFGTPQHLSQHKDRHCDKQNYSKDLDHAVRGQKVSKRKNENSFSRHESSPSTSARENYETQNAVNSINYYRW